MDNQWLQWAIELQSLAQAGLTYGKDVYDKERYERIREISAEIMAHLSDTPLDKVKELFCNETGYAYGVCKIFVMCSVIGGQFEQNIETTEFRYFAEHELPKLATEKNNEEQIQLCFIAYRSDNWTTVFD